MSRRLADAYARYATLIIAQLEALEAGDIDALGPLARQRDVLAGEIDATAPGGESPDPAQTAEVRRQLDRCQAADLRLRERLGTLRAGALDAVRRLGRDAAAARSYVATTPPGAQVDVEL